MTNGRPTAILFDLWGTLIVPGTDAVSRLIADDLGMTALRFVGFAGPDGARYDGDAAFTGPETGRLRGLLHLLYEPEGRP